MRTGGYTSQQSLTAEAASIVKQAVSLARRRGHAQVTPLHVASSMLASSTGLFRRSCLQSHSHPLQCKALELCFNVALNRLPTSASSSILGPHSHFPSLSNALVAAFKRAQAHQRRGSIENQQQPILALKVELEQLVISILDDPSVSRVMREAGFSSTQVKAEVERFVSLENSSQSPPGSIQTRQSNRALAFATNVSQFQPTPTSQFRETLDKQTDQIFRNDDVLSLLDTMMSKKTKNTIVVGESLASAEAVVRGLIGKFNKGDVPGELRYVQFISLRLFSLRNLSKEEVEHKLADLVKSYLGRGVVLYFGDVNWICEYRSSYGENNRKYNCPVEHMILELSRLLSGYGESGKLWLMGIATFQTYMRCKAGRPSLETLWELQPLTIPVGSLELSLNLESDSRDQFGSKVSGVGSSWLNKSGVENQLTCCADCLANFKREAQSIGNKNLDIESTTTSISSSLPSWLRQYKEENTREIVSVQVTKQEFDKVGDLSNKWNSICSSGHKHPLFLEKSPNLSLSPSSSTSVSSYGQHSPQLYQTSWPVLFETNQSPKEHQFISQNEGAVPEPKLRTFIPISKPELLSNPNSSPNSASSSESSEDIEFLHGFKEYSSENLMTLCNALEKMVPRQKDIIPEIVSTVLECRSGMRKRKNNLNHSEEKEETWLFFLGVDNESKERVARGLAKIVFGSQSSFAAIGLSSFSSTRADSTEDFNSKRARDEHGRTYFDRFADAVQDNPSRVFLMEDVEQVDYHSQFGIKNAIESGRLDLSNGKSAPLKDAIVIFCCETFSSMSRACSPPARQKFSDGKEKESEDNSEDARKSAPLDLNVATEDEHGDEHSVSDIGFLKSVDRLVMFKILVL